MCTGSGFDESTSERVKITHSDDEFPAGANGATLEPDSCSEWTLDIGRTDGIEKDPAGSPTVRREKKICSPICHIQ